MVINGAEAPKPAGTDVRLISVTKKFGERTVLKNVSLSVAPGEVVSIIGPSGSGKSTLLRCVNRLETPTSGEVWIGDTLIGFATRGNEATPLTEREVARQRQNVGMVFQQFHLFRHRTALENVMEAPVTVLKRKPDIVRQEAMELLAQVGLANLAGSYPSQLSGGEQQRVALARAFINEPRLLFADEPTGNLDAENSEHVVELLFGLNKAAGTALVLVTHNPELAHLTHRVIRLKSGAVVEDTTQ